MTPPYIKIIYKHHAGSEYQRIVYVANDGQELDISAVVERIEVIITAGDIVRYVMRGPFPVIQVLDDEA